MHWRGRGGRRVGDRVHSSSWCRHLGLAVLGLFLGTLTPLCTQDVACTQSLISLRHDVELDAKNLEQKQGLTENLMGNPEFNPILGFYLKFGSEAI